MAETAATQGVGAFHTAVNSRLWPAEGAPLLREVILR